MIFALLIVFNAGAGEVVAFKPKTPAPCATRLAGPRLTRLDPLVARETHEGLLERIRTTDPRGVLMRVDFTGRIWDWTPLDEAIFLDVTFARNAAGQAILAMVTRGRDERDVLVDTPEKIRELEAALKIQLENASVMIDEDLEMLHLRRRLTDGFIY